MAMKLFDCMPQRNVISWTAMIAGLSKNGRIDEAHALFNTMPERNVNLMDCYDYGLCAEFKVGRSS